MNGAVATVSRRRDRRTRSVFFLALLTPALVILLGVLGFPIIRSVELSFESTSIATGKSSFVALTNFESIITDSEFWRSAWNSVVYVTGASVLAFAIGLALALALRREFGGRAFFRTALLIPWLLPIISVSLLWQWILNPQFGLVDQALVQIGAISNGIAWLSQSSTAMIGVVVTTGWQQFPFVMVMLLAALQSVPEDLTSAASIDGANGVQAFRAVVWPVLRPVAFIVAVVLVISNLQNYTTIQTMTGGGPADATNTFAVYLYNLGFKSFNFGGAAAASVLITGATFLLTWLAYLRQARKDA